MFCPKCGTSLNGNEDFCSSCGANIKVIKEKMARNNAISNNESKEKLNQSNDSVLSTTEDLSNRFNKIFSPILNGIKDFFHKHKKVITMVVCCFVLVFLSLFLFYKFIGFERLSWDNSYIDSKTKYVTQTNLNLGVKFSNLEKVDEIKYSSTCGEIKGKGLSVIWNLTDSIGDCEITASYKLKKIKKLLKVIPFDIKEDELGFEYEVDKNSLDDLDLDGLTNKEETEYKTNLEVDDTDLDGLNDYYEIFTSKTNPNKKDSDEDGLTDYDEVELKLDPNNADSKNDGIKDGERTLSYNYETDFLELSITGKGNIASTVATVTSNTKISGKKGLIDNLFSLHTEGLIQDATLTLFYADEDIIKYGLNEDNLVVYYYNDKESKYEKVNSIVDKENNTVTAQLKHFSNYVLGDNSLLKEDSSTEVLFVLDNSWSLYTNEQYEKYTGKKYNSKDSLGGFDKEGVRFSLTKDLVSRLSTKSFQIGLSEFRADYANALPIGSDSNTINNKLDSMIGNFITHTEGTNIGNALIRGIDEFGDDVDNKYVIILTDGQDDYLRNKVNRIIDKANKNAVKICSIGFGVGSYNTELYNISNGTGCKFYSSSNAVGLTELFESIGSELNDNLVDVDGDNVTDGILIADSGFVVNRDGFSFNNFTVAYKDENEVDNGQCYGMATFAELYYKKVLPLTVGERAVGNDYAFPYDLSGTFFAKNTNLYDYKLKTNALKYSFGFEQFGEDNPADFHVLNENVLDIKDDYKKEIEDSDLYSFLEVNSHLNKEAQLKKYGFNYSKVIDIYLNYYKMQTNNLINNEDLQMINAIHTSYIRQKATAHYSSASNFILWARNILHTETTSYVSGPAFINVLMSRLKDNDVPVISSSFNGNGLHAINAISLVQDKDNPNYYYIGVYDNNYSGEKRYVDVECKKNSCLTVANKYYGSSSQPIRITPSLEYDLSFYN